MILVKRKWWAFCYCCSIHFTLSWVSANLTTQCAYWCDVLWMPFSLYALHYLCGSPPCPCGLRMSPPAGCLPSWPPAPPPARTREVFRSNGNVLLLLLHLPVLFKYFVLAALLLEMAWSASGILGPRKLEINWLQCVTCNHLLLLTPSSSWLRGGQFQLCLNFLLTVESQRIFPFLSCGISINCLPDFYF